MAFSVLLQNIEAMRQRVGIDDDDLHKEIRGLKVGDVVRLTLVAGEKSVEGETVLVKIIDISDATYRGTLTGRPTAKALEGFEAGSTLTFAAMHIHSLKKATDEDEPVHHRRHH